MLTTKDYAAMANDLDICDLGMAIAPAGMKRKFKKQREAIFRAIHAQNERDGLGDMNDDDLLAALSA